MHNGRRFRRKTGVGKIYTVCHNIMFLNGLINKSINGNTIVSIKLFSSCMPTAILILRAKILSFFMQKMQTEILTGLKF
jgi:hypothetical protein